MRRFHALAVSLGVLAALAPSRAVAQSGSMLPGFNSSTLPANDDGSTGAITLPFDVNYFGTTYSQVYVNNNGNLTFSGPLATFTPFNLYTTSEPIVAAFFADVDTRHSGSAETQYGTGTVDSRSAFGATWNGVGYYNTHADKLNFFQALLVDRQDTGVGNFDIQFRYGSMQWNTGDFSGGSGGFGGSSARVGFSAGDNNPAHAFEEPGSGVDRAFTDGGPFALNGRILIYEVRNGIPTTVIPEPGSLILLGTGLGGLAARFVRKRRKQAIA